MDFLRRLLGIRIEPDEKSAEPKGWPELGYGDVPDEALAVLKGFLRDRHAWEIEAHGKLEVAQAEAAYNVVLTQYCHAEVVPQGIATSSRPDFAPGTYTIEQGAVSGNRCRIRVHTENDEHEARLLQDASGWRLRHLYYVDIDEYYEGL